MKTKLFLVLAVLLAITGITSYAERLDNISIVEDIKCYQENESIYVASESERDIFVYTAVYNADGALKNVKKIKKSIKDETEFTNIYPSGLKNGEYYKIFVWDSNMRPLTNVIYDMPNVDTPWDNQAEFPSLTAADMVLIQSQINLQEKNGQERTILRRTVPSRITVMYFQ